MSIRTVLLMATLLVPGWQQNAGADELVEEDVTISIPEDISMDELYQDIRIAAKKACKSRAVYAHRQLRLTSECRQQFVADAIDAIDSEPLTALYLDDTGRSSERLAKTDS